MLGRVGLEIFDYTPDLVDLDRNQEIREWMVNHDVERFAVLDDDYDAFFAEMPQVNFKTSFEHGLTDDIKERVIAYLNHA